MVHFTKQERDVIIFFASILVIGTAVNFLLKKNIPVNRILAVDPDFCKIDINTADKQMLMQLPGIGETLAQRIIEYRSAQKPFTDLEDLKSVKGIHPRVYERVKEQIIIRKRNVP